jgi:hypothetical protein
MIASGDWSAGSIRLLAIQPRRLMNKTVDFRGDGLAGYAEPLTNRSDYRVQFVDSLIKEPLDRFEFQLAERT